ncbi:MAG: CRTAC1 family protein, partial [bacterium]|nr:CRTAC1 family protein [bacterium]
IDVVVSCLNERAELFRNVSDRNRRWLQLGLVGRQSNRDAIGARIRLTSTTGADQYNHVTTSVGFASSSTKRVHFGLGADSSAARIEIRWPAGKVQVLENVEADQYLVVREPE